MAYTKVESIDHLIELCGDDRVDFFIHGGAFRSSKGIMYFPDSEEFDIHNEIDDSWQEVKKENLDRDTHIVEAINKGAFYMY
jgi:hypothetical protein